MPQPSIEPTPPMISETAPVLPAAAPPLEPMTPAACAAQLKQLFPALFGGAAKPLKLRIQADIQERAPGLFSKQLLSAVLRRHTGGHAYLVALTRATHRVDLDGEPAGELSAEHRQVAFDELAQRRSNQASRQALEEEQRHNRATLLHDFEQTTLTPANFSALKGISLQEMESYLATAREEAQIRSERQPVAQHQRRPDGDPRHKRGPR